MIMKRYSKHLILISCLTLVGCAQFVPPTGGKKDETPPELVSSVPINKSRNVSSQQLILTFNEGIDVTGLRQDLIVSPEITGGFEVKSSLKEVTLKFNQPLQKNTTYTFNFRNGIKDLNEKNPAKNLKLVFSTGPIIDSLGLKGKVENLQTNKPANEVLVGLYQLKETDTLAYYERKPDYFIKTDTTGQFLFENLKSAPYKLLAFQDKNNNLLPDPPTEWLGILPDTIEAKIDIPEYALSIYQADKKGNKIKRKLARIQNHSITFDKPVEKYQIEWKDSTQAMWVIEKPNELLFIPKPNQKIDTSFVTIQTVDSVRNQTTFTEKIYLQEGNPAKRNIQAFNFTTKPENARALIELSEIDFFFPNPVTDVQNDRIRIYQDSTQQIAWKGSWKDQGNTHYQLTFPTIKQPGKWKLEVDSKAFTSYQGDTTTSRKLTFDILSKEETGTITIQLTQPCTYCLLEYKRVGDSQPAYQPIQKEVRLNQLIPGDYSFRVLYDSNENGLWDNGDYREGIPAERWYVYPAIIRLKPNFEINQTFNNPVENKPDQSTKTVESTGEN